MKAELLSVENQEQVKSSERIYSMIGEYSLKSIPDFVRDWKQDFTERMRTSSGSKSRNFTFKNGTRCTSLIDKPFDKLMIQYVNYIAEKPLKQNDYFKYCDSYFHGKSLDLKYFRHDVDKLKDYYRKIDNERKEAKKENRESINIFSRSSWEKYVLFMMLKMSGLYADGFDELFNVKQVKSREYNPITNLPRVLRQSLPFKIKEYDIKQAYPTFLFMQLEMNPIDVYDVIDKKKFNMLINTHKDVKGYSLQKAREELRPIFGDRTDEVLTRERYENRGKMFEDLTALEKEYIEKFVKINRLNNYVRLHDSVVVKSDIECNTLLFGKVEFKTKGMERPVLQEAPMTFYDSNYETSPARYARYFKQEGFIRITKDAVDKLTIIKNDKKIVKPFNHETDILNYLRREINELDTSYLENVISKDAYYIRAGFLLMNGHPLELHRDTKENVFIPFKNGVAKIGKDSVEMIPYSDESIRFFMDCESVKHEFNFDDEAKGKGEFRDFFYRAITGKHINLDELTESDSDAIIKFSEMIGYLISNYKNPSETYAIILSDEGADNTTRNGGRGKGLLHDALSKVRLILDRNGDSFDTNYRHKFSDLQREHDVFGIDDVPANFNYNSFYSEITGSISVERKGSPAEIIPFEWSPKFLISTNFSVRYNKRDTSTVRRFREYQFSNYWNNENNPYSVYGRNFFFDWDAPEWNRFYILLVECVQMYLKYGVEQIEYDKDADNYRAYFPDSIKEDEMKRILQVMRDKKPEGFTVTDVLMEYNDGAFKFEKLFHRNNIREHIQVYVTQHDMKLKYTSRNKSFQFIDEDKSESMF